MSNKYDVIILIKGKGESLSHLKIAAGIIHWNATACTMVFTQWRVNHCYRWYNIGGNYEILRLSIKMANMYRSWRYNRCVTQCTLGPLLLTSINFNPTWISKYIRYNVWDEMTFPFLKFGNGQVISYHIYWACDYLSMLRLWKIHVNKRGTGDCR